MAEIYIPTLHSFAMGNIFTGSCGAFRFRIDPQIAKKSPKEVDMEASSIVAEIWYGEKCYELSTVEGRQEYPMTEAGRGALKAWLESHIQ